MQVSSKWFPKLREVWDTLLYIDTEHAEKKRTHICREMLMTQTYSSVGGGFSIVRTLKANVAPPEALRGLSEDHFKFIATDADRSIRSSEGKLSGDRYRVLSSQQTDGASSETSIWCKESD